MKIANRIVRGSHSEFRLGCTGFMILAVFFMAILGIILGALGAA